VLQVAIVIGETLVIVNRGRHAEWLGSLEAPVDRTKSRSPILDRRIDDALTAIGMSISGRAIRYRGRAAANAAHGMCPDVPD
jgi:hypothetical protein